MLNYNLDVVNHAEQFSHSLCCFSVCRNNVRVKEFTFYSILLPFSKTEITLYMNLDIIGLLSRKKNVPAAFKVACMLMRSACSSVLSKM